MSILEAIILGLIQGLTEFLPVSSSGHIELIKALMGIEIEEDLLFTLTVHGATVLSTIAVFYKDILSLITEGLTFRRKANSHYIGMLIFSMLPLALIGILFKEKIEMLFDGNLTFVGAMLIVTALLLFITSKVKSGTKSVTYASAFIIGIAQTIAILPGISRSGSTIATGLLLGVSKQDITKFSFLMVLAPIIGANLMAMFSAESSAVSTEVMPLVIGFFTAFISGFMACKWMIKIVKKGKLSYFAAYCFVVGLITIWLAI